MDLELLRTFLEVNRTRHFGRAAEALYLTQAAVSARIKLLESTLGVRLFDRIRRDIRLTPEGHRLVRYADLLIAEWRKARQDVAAGGAQRQIALGGSLRLWDILQPWLNRICREYPEMAVIAESHTPEVLVRRLLDGLLDVAFMSEPPQVELLDMRSIATIHLQMISSHPDITIAAALTSDYIMVDWGLSHALHHRRLFPDAPEAQIRVGQARMALELMLDVGGTAYLPWRVVKEDVQAGRLYPVSEAPVIERETYAVYPVRSARREILEELIGLFEPIVE